MSALRLPPPQPGRRSSSSGRAVQTTRIGTSVAQSTRWSMKSRRPSSAQWMSSKTSTRGRGLGQRLEEAAPRRERLARGGRRRPPPGLPGRRAGRDARPPIAPRPRRARRVVTAVPSLAAASSAESDSRMPACAFTISPSAQKLTPSPYGQRAALAPVGEDLGIVVERRVELEHEPALADPGCSDERDELRGALALGHGRAHPGGVELVARARRARRRRGRRCRHRGGFAARPPPRRGPARTSPWPATGSASRYSITRSVARYVVSSTRMPSTGAADWRRAAVLTTSPVAMPSPSLGRAESATRASPVVTPIRT